MNILYLVCQQTLYCMIPLLIVALGGLFSEKSGTLNIALEGVMMSGAFSACMFIHMMQAGGGLDGQPLLLIAVLLAGITGMAVSFFHALASVTWKANQVISGFAINIFVPAITILIARATIGVLQVDFNNTFRIDAVPFLSDIPVIGKMFFQRTYITTLIGIIILILSIIVQYKTKFGMRLQACGEHPQAADSVGINVGRVRYMGILISGFLCGIGGVAFIIPNTTEYAANVAGYGYLAYAILIFGQWRPKRIFIASIFFGLMKTLASIYSSVPLLLNLGLDSYAFKIIPYAATLIVLAFVSKNRFRQPSALGVPYDKSVR